MENSSGGQVVDPIATIQTGSEFCKRINEISLNCSILTDRRERTRQDPE